MLSLFDSCAIFIIYDSNLSWSCVKIKKTSPIYLNKTKGWNCCVYRYLVSILSIKIQEYIGENLVPIAVTSIWCLTWALDWKYLFLTTNSAILTRSSVEILFSSILSSFSLRALNLALIMQGYNPTKLQSQVSHYQKKFSTSYLFYKITEVFNSRPPLIADHSLDWLTKNSEVFSAGIPQLDIIVLPGTS